LLIEFFELKWSNFMWGFSSSLYIKFLFNYFFLMLTHIGPGSPKVNLFRIIESAFLWAFDFSCHPTMFTFVNYKFLIILNSLAVLIVCRLFKFWPRNPPYAVLCEIFRIMRWNVFCMWSIADCFYLLVVLYRKSLSSLKELIETCLVEPDGSVQLHAAKVINLWTYTYKLSSTCCDWMCSNSDYFFLLYFDVVQ